MPGKADEQQPQGYGLPWPPSVNHYYRRVGPRVLISRDGRLYRQKVVALSRGLDVERLEGRLELEIELHPPDRRRRDVDNSLKCLLDSLAHAGLYGDDSQIHMLTVTKREPMPPDGMTYIRIAKWNDSKAKCAATP